MPAPCRGGPRPVRAGFRLYPARNPARGSPDPGRVDCRSGQFLQPEMLPSGSQLSGVFLAIRVTFRVTGLPVLA